MINVTIFGIFSYRTFGYSTNALFSFSLGLKWQSHIYHHAKHIHVGSDDSMFASFAVCSGHLVESDSGLQ